MYITDVGPVWDGETFGEYAQCSCVFVWLGFFDSLFGSNIIRTSGQFWMMNSLENGLSIFCIFLNLLFDNNIIHTSGQFWMINPLENALSFFVCVCVCLFLSFSVFVFDLFGSH